MKKIKDIIGISLICAVALQPKVSFGETNNTILKEGSSPKLMYNGKTSNREILLGAPYESQSILNANSYSLEKYDEYVGTPYTRSVLYETRSLTPVTS